MHRVGKILKGKNMKKITNIPIRTMALTLAMFMLLTVVAFAGDPIPGVGVNAGKNPGGIIKSNSTSDAKGNFTFPPLDEVSLQITVSAAEVKKAIATANKMPPRKDGKPNTVVILVAPSSNSTVNGQKRYGEIALSATKDNVIIVDLAKAGTISGTITTQTDSTNK